MLYQGQKLIDTVEAAYEETDRLGGTLTRQIAAAYLKMRGINYDSKELSAVVKQVKDAHGVTTSRVTFKEKTIQQIGGEIFTDDELKTFFLDNEIAEDEATNTVAKYRRYLEVANRAYQKGLAEAANNNKKAS